MNYHSILKHTSIIAGSVCGVLTIKNFIVKENIKHVHCEDSATKTKDTDAESKLKLKQVQLFFRHGARTPLHTIPNVDEAKYEENILLVQVPHTVFKFKDRDMNSGGPRPESRYDNYYAKHILKGGSQVGALTQLGQEQMYMIGRELRKQYIDKLGFIDKQYNPEQVHVRSTNIHRTIRTARCILAGMYGKKNLDSLEEPPVIHIKASIIDELLPRPSACKVLRQLNHAAMIHGGDHPDVIGDRLQLENALGIPPDHTEGKKKLDFIQVRDDIRAREAHGFQIPSIVKPYVDMIEKNANLLMYFAHCGQHEAERVLAMRLSSGPLLHMVMGTLDDKQNNSPRFHIYSTHDSTLVALIASLGFYDEKWPPFGADVRFELYEDGKKNKFVKVSYCGEEKIVRGCTSKLCPMNEFKQAMEPYTIEDKEYKEVCSSNILEVIAKEMMDQEKGEVEDTESQEKSDIAAGM